MIPITKASLHSQLKEYQDYILLSYLSSIAMFALLLFAIEGNTIIKESLLTFICLILIFASLALLGCLLEKRRYLAHSQLGMGLLLLALPIFFTAIILLTGNIEIYAFRLLYLSPLLLAVLSTGKLFGLVNTLFIASHLVLMNYAGGGVFLLTIFDLSFVIFGVWVVWVMGDMVEREKQNQLELIRKNKAELLDIQIREYKKRITRLREQRHDFHNHIQVIYIMLQMSRIQQSLDYIQNMIEKREREYAENPLLAHRSTLNALLLIKKEEAEERDIRFTVKKEFEGAEGLSSLPLSQSRLARILFNLIDNAIEALEGYCGRREIEIRALDDGDHFTVEVRNTGPRIPEAIRDAIFEGGFSTKGDGRSNRGYGLKIVKDTIEEADGSIEVISKRTFTCFRCRLPKTTTQ